MIKKFYIDDKTKIDIPECACCIGYFDGVHIGHQALIQKTVQIANKYNIEPYLITFYPDPADIISKKKTKHINTFERRLKLFDQFGIKGVIIISFNLETMQISKEDFVSSYLEKLNMKALVCGFDFHYGYKGLGNYKTLKDALKGKVKVEMVEEVKYYGKKVSSTRIREEIKKGNLKLVDKLLGYHY